MKLHIDLEHETVELETPEGTRRLALASEEAFQLISRAWLRAGWDLKHVYTFSWLGRPIIQLPEDLIRLQEWIYQVKPDVIIEIGIAHGGSLVFSAGLCRLIGRGRVIGIDIEIRPHNRLAIEAHELADLITMIEGDSIAGGIVRQVRQLIHPGERVMVFLDGCHTRDHVLAELEAYGPLVAEGSYIIAMDGIMQDLAGAPRSEPDWKTNNPRQAAMDFVKLHSEFRLVEPPFAFNESELTTRITYWPGGVIQRVAPAAEA